MPRPRLPIVAAAALSCSVGSCMDAPNWRIEQITTGPANHFFGYDGHQQTYPWSGDGRFILALQTPFHDRMPRGHQDAASIVLIDTDTGAVRPVAETHAWNFQQGSMLYWNPENADEEFFFNDRRADDRVFAVRYNFRTGERREYLFPDMSIGNGNVAPSGGRFLAFNYGRVFREVVSYPGAANFTAGEAHPANDGLFVVDADSGEATLIASYLQIYELLRGKFPELSEAPAGIFNQLFINHTYWNRSEDRIWFVARWFRSDSKLIYHTEGFTVSPDGSDLRHSPVKLSHPDWEHGRIMLSGGLAIPGEEPGDNGKPRRHHVLYDTDANRVVEVIDPSFFVASGEPAFSPDLRWIASTEGGTDERGRVRRIIVYDRKTRSGFRLRFFRNGFPAHPKPDNPLRIDMPPRWNRDGTKLLFEALADDNTRQLFVAHLQIEPVTDSEGVR